MNELIQTFQGQLAGESQSLVNARDLHAVLGVGKDFSNWVKSRIEQYDFIEGQDYSPNLANRSFGIGKPKTEYHLSLDMAKELCLVENTEQGKKARRYFIEVEKQARQQIPAFLRRGDNNLGSPAEHQIAVMRSVVLETKPIWAKIRRYFEAGLTQKEMLRLLDIGDTALRQHLRHMALCGLVDYKPNAASIAGGKAAYAKKLAVQHVH